MPISVWLSQFRQISDSHKDSYGNKFRYTWFYPYDHHNGLVLKQLSEMVYKGYGEVELHWHRPPEIAQKFPHMLEEAIDWFHKYGALMSSEPPYLTHFGFVAGNWDLDNCRGLTGINNDLEVLYRHGCYADFTFSTIGTDCQPRMVNTIYYAFDDPKKPKSYDVGVPVQVGKPRKGLMIFEGPLLFTWKNAGLEYGAVEYYAVPNSERINRWIDANVHVKGKPEWVFVKVYSHGCQSAEVILNHYLNSMLSSLQNICQEREIKLHYMTAREAYNVVKAAEAGERGNPEQYRNYLIPQPYNAVHRKMPGSEKTLPETF